MGMLSRRKGCRGEQEVVQLLLPVFPMARSKRAGGESSPIDRGRDILGTNGFCVQVMRAQRPDIHRKLAEAVGCAQPDEIALALTRRDRGEWLATLPAKDLVALLGQLEKLRGNFAKSVLGSMDVDPIEGPIAP